jgi:hypothetical protein
MFDVPKAVEAVSSLLETGIKRIWPDPTEEERSKIERLKIETTNALDVLRIQLSAIIAEAQSEDPWTSRARPTFLYVMYAVIGMCFIGGILGIWWPDQVQRAATNIAALLNAVPDDLWWLFGAGYLGYTGFRSMDKRNRTR